MHTYQGKIVVSFDEGATPLMPSKPCFKIAQYLPYYHSNSNHSNAQQRKQNGLLPPRPSSSRQVSQPKQASSLRLFKDSFTKTRMKAFVKPYVQAARFPTKQDLLSQPVRCAQPDEENDTIDTVSTCTVEEDLGLIFAIDDDKEGEEYEYSEEEDDDEEWEETASLCGTLYVPEDNKKRCGQNH